MLKAISSFFKAKQPPSLAVTLYGAIVEQARQPGFYRDRGVPDTLDGRFDLLVLHAFLVLRRLNGLGPEGQAMAQELADLIFTDMDGNLREIGVGDLSVGKRIKAMAKAFFGRLTVYDKALAGVEGGEDLTQALLRNLYGTFPQADPAQAALVAGYVRAADALLAGQGADTLLKGQVSFPPVP